MENKDNLQEGIDLTNTVPNRYSLAALTSPDSFVFVHQAYSVKFIFNSIQFFIISVLHQQPEGHLQMQHKGRTK
jgi:hypothetical protein